MWGRTNPAVPHAGVAWARAGGPAEPQKWGHCAGRPSRRERVTSCHARSLSVCVQRLKPCYPRFSLHGRGRAHVQVSPFGPFNSRNLPSIRRMSSPCLSLHGGGRAQDQAKPFGPFNTLYLPSVQRTSPTWLRLWPPSRLWSRAYEAIRQASLIPIRFLILLGLVCLS